MAACLLLGAVSPVAAQVRSPSAQTKAPPQASLDVTAVTLSDILRLYFGYIDPRPYAVCSEAVGDMRRVTLRAPANLTLTALKAILDLHGYAVRERGGVLLVCGKDQMSGRGDVDVRRGADGTQVYSARPQRSASLPPADTWGPPDGSPLSPPSDANPMPQPISAAQPIELPKSTSPRIYRPVWRAPGELLPVISQTGLGRVLNLAGSGGVPATVPDVAQTGGAVSGSFLQTGSDYIAWQGTDDDWGKLCPLVEALDVPLPSVAADVYVLSVSTTKSDSDGVSVVGRAAGLDFGVGSTRSNSVGIGIGAANLVLSSVRTNENVRLVQHFTAQLVNARRQLLNSGASVPITTDVVDLEGGKTRQAQEYRTVGTAVTIDPRILGSAVQLDMTVELSSVSSTRVSGATNPTFNTEKIQTTVDVRPNTVSFVSALAASSQTRSREKFFFIPVGRTDEARRSDIVYMIVLHALDVVDDTGRKSVCPQIEAEGKKAPRPRHCTDGGPSSPRAGPSDPSCSMK